MHRYIRKKWAISNLRPILMDQIIHAFLSEESGKHIIYSFPQATSSINTVCADHIAHTCLQQWRFQRQLQLSC